MRKLIIAHLVALFAILVALVVFLADLKTAIIVALVMFGVTASGALTAYFYFQRGKVYEKRGQSGPDH